MDRTRSALKTEDEVAAGTLDDMNIHNSLVSPKEEEKKEVLMEFLRNPQSQRNFNNNESSIYDIEVKDGLLNSLKETEFITTAAALEMEAQYDMVENFEKLN